jgi:hypothetical protein
LSLLCEVETADAISLNDPDEAFNRNHSLTGSWDCFGLDEKDSLAEYRETKKRAKKWLRGTEDNHGSNVREVGTPLSRTYVIARAGPQLIRNV